MNLERTRKLIQSFDFKTLFIEELGWDRYKAELDVSVDSQNFRLRAFSEKRGMVVLICDPGMDGSIPDYSIRRKIDRQVKKSHHEHLIIYVAADKSKQIWQWVKREQGKPVACREHPYYASQPGDSLIQKIDDLAFSLEEEEQLTIVEVGRRARRAFDVEKITKRFYDRFKAEHGKFTKFLKGIPEDKFQRWYVSVMLNRLMFIYFIQKKGFLDDNTDYLRARLGRSKQQGKDRYYKNFLCPLFFEGFAKKEEDRSPENNKLLGRVPYLDGGLFQEHQVEKLYGKEIRIPDKAFDHLFSFFEQYQWHLDERPLRADNEINPDVLGYIFEKYINQKQMGAYYTKEDITGYISKNTIIPFLFDQAQKKCRIAFEGGQAVWQLLKEDPGRYIYDAVKKGVELELPKEIAAGIKDVSQRTGWNKPAPYEYALPTEIWREVVARRQRYEEVRDTMSKGEISSINDLITYNLDIRQFAQDVIENCEGPEILRAIYYTIAGRIPEMSNQKFQPGMSVLDPTCGSGAFLFAALNILEPLYEACLDRMQVFLDELESSGQKYRSDKFGDFRKILERIDQHPNRRYFILKSIILSNLYGVDIMEEAIEICKLRLFLKLVAQVDSVDKIEPLPDIDFNIRAGNTLVGFVRHNEVKEAITTAEGGQKKLLFGESVEAMTRIEENAEIADGAFKIFQEMQTKRGMDTKDFADAKQKLSTKLKVLEDELDTYLASEYGIPRNGTRKEKEYQKFFTAWRKKHQSFHWFVEFYGIMKEGGFDVIVGNPPYVEYTKVKKDYALPPGIYKTEPCGNLYAFIYERCIQLIAENGFVGLIIPVASVCTGRFGPLQDCLFQKGVSVVSNFNDRPSKLFDGLEHSRLSIILHKQQDGAAGILSSGYCKWTADERTALFSKLSFVDSTSFSRSGSMAKIGTEVESKVLRKLLKDKTGISLLIRKSGADKVYFTRKLSYFVQVLGFVPTIIDHEGNRRDPSELKTLTFDSKKISLPVLSLLNSSLFYWWITCYSDCRNLNKREILNFPFNPKRSSPEFVSSLALLATKLMEDLSSNSEMRTMDFKSVGTLQIQCTIPRLSKNLIDEIDRVLARHYGLTTEELDFIMNYDIKYRMGLI